MWRVSTKENKNPFQLARESLGLSREKASELLKIITPERIEKIENEKTTPYPEEILAMADGYHMPDLCNYFCSNVCPIGQVYVPEVKLRDLSRIVLEMIASLNNMNSKKDRLIEIAADGNIANDEIDDFIAIQEELEKISITISALQLWSEKMLSSGAIDLEAYHAKREQSTWFKQPLWFIKVAASILLQTWK